VSLQLGAVDGDSRTIELNNSGTIAGRGDALPSGQTAGVRLFNGTGGGTVTVDGDITNSGTISSETSAAILIEDVNYTGTITNTGTLSGTSAVDASSATAGIDFVQGTGGSLEGDFIGSTNGTDNFTFADGSTNALNFDVQNDVDVVVGNAAAIDVSGERSIDGTFASDGSLTFDAGIDSLEVSGDVDLNEGSTLTVNNSATINGLDLNDGLAGLVINAGGELNDNSDSVFNNTGTINGVDGVAIDGANSDQNITLNLQGSVNGDVLLGTGNDQVSVTNGSVNGAVDLGDGNNSAVVNSGSVSGGLSGGSGQDSVSISSASVAGGVDLGDGTNSLALSNGSVSGGISAGAGQDSVNISGGSVSGGVNLGGGTNSLNINNASVSGGISGGSGQDTVSINGGSVSGNVNLGAGADTLALNSGSISGDVLLGGGNDVLTVSGGSISGQVSGQGSGVVNIDLGANGVFVSNGVNNVEDYNILSGRVEQNGDFSTAGTTTTVSQGATLAFDSAINGGGAFVSNGNLAFTPIGSTGPILNQNGTVTLNAGSTITLPEFTSAADVGQVTNLIQATSLIDNGFIFNENNFLLDINGVISGNQNLTSEVVVTDLGALTNNDNDGAFADAIAQSIGAGGLATVDLANILFDFDENNVAGFQSLLNDLTPSLSGAVTLGAYQLVESSQRINRRRFASGDVSRTLKRGLWVDVVDGSSSQDDNNGIAGFDSDLSGFGIGFDRQFNRWNLGIAYASTDADVDNNGALNDSVQIDNDQISVYGDYQADKWFIGGLASYSDLDYDLSRSGGLPGEGQITGSTSGNLLDLSVNGGYKLIDSDWNVSAISSLSYSSLDVDSFSEVGGLALGIDYADVDRLRSELGLLFSGTSKLSNWTLTPSLKLAWEHDFEGDATAVAANIGGVNFTQLGNQLDDDLFNVGAALDFSNEKGMTISISYEGEYGSIASRVTK